MHQSGRFEMIRYVNLLKVGRPARQNVTYTIHDKNGTISRMVHFQDFYIGKSSSVILHLASPSVCGECVHT